MTAVPQPEHASKHAAVLVLLFPQNNQLHTVLIERPAYDGVHSGQMAFPGGGLEAHDADWVAAALRETHEELGVPPAEPVVLGPLTPLYIPPSGYFVQPILAALPAPWAWQPDAAEVASVHVLPLQGFRKELVDLPRAGVVPAWGGGPQPIWGASAMILAEVLALRELRTFAFPNEFD
jgi:8-oxo-dGTP pyrophosphatase MutT (NUDIX family)